MSTGAADIATMVGSVVLPNPITGPSWPTTAIWPHSARSS